MSGLEIVIPTRAQIEAAEEKRRTATPLSDEYWEAVDTAPSVSHVSSRVSDDPDRPRFSSWRSQVPEHSFVHLTPEDVDGMLSATSTIEIQEVTK